MAQIEPSDEHPERPADNVRFLLLEQAIPWIGRVVLAAVVGLFAWLSLGELAGKTTNFTIGATIAVTIGGGIVVQLRRKISEQSERLQKQRTRLDEYEKALDEARSELFDAQVEAASLQARADLLERELEQGGGRNGESNA